MIETQNQNPARASYKCTSCAMVKTVTANETAPTCCGKAMEETAETGSKAGESHKGTCCSS